MTSESAREAGLDSQRPAYSRAFDKLAGDDPENIVNLVAYALYKKGIWETVALGSSPTPRPNRDPSPTEVNVYREAAEQRLQAFATTAIEEAAPGIREFETSRAIASSKSEIIAAVAARTSWWPAFLVNVGAWILSPISSLMGENSEP